VCEDTLEGAGREKTRWKDEDKVKNKTRGF